MTEDLAEEVARTEDLLHRRAQGVRA
jgi:hypothetical protein